MTVGVSYVVAPFEADHQPVYLAQAGLVYYVFTVDADLLCYAGVRVVRVLRAVSRRATRSCKTRRPEQVEDPDDVTL